MKSKAGHKLKKIRKLAILTTTLTGCIFSPEPKTVHEDYSVPPECLHYDSTTWTDTSEVEHMSCKIDSLPNIRPPAP